MIYNPIVTVAQRGCVQVNGAHIYQSSKRIILVHIDFATKRPQEVGSSDGEFWFSITENNHFVRPMTIIDVRAPWMKQPRHILQMGKYTADIVIHETESSEKCRWVDLSQSPTG